MFNLPSKLVDILFYSAVAAMAYFVLPLLSDFITSVSNVDTQVFLAVKDVFLVWAAVWFCSKRNHTLS